THTFNEYGKKLSRAEAIEFIGPPLKDAIRKFAPDKVDAMVETYRKHNLQYHDTYVKAFPNVAETLTKLKKNRVNFGVVTTKMRATVDMWLQVTDLDSYYDTISTIDYVSQA